MNNLLKYTLQFTIYIIIVTSIMILAGFFNEPLYEEKPCSYYSDIEIQDVPARCLEYFNNLSNAN